VRLDELGGLFVDRPITPLPSPVPQLLGVAGFRGAVVPVYDLAALLGHRRAGSPRWMVLTSGADAVALAFDSVAGHLRAPGLLPRGGTTATGGHGTPEVVHFHESLWPVLSIPALLGTIAGFRRGTRVGGG
jgi:purine-binding chemotaxis protein CheW